MLTKFPVSHEQSCAIILMVILSLSISAEVEARLKLKAAAAGVDVATYAVRHLEMLVEPAKTIEELSGPIGEAFAKSGMTEDELSDFLEEEKHAMRAERRMKQGHEGSDTSRP